MDCDQYTPNDTTLSVEDLDMLRGYDMRRPVADEEVPKIRVASVEDRTPATPLVPDCRDGTRITGDGRYSGYPYRVGDVNPYSGRVEGFTADLENPTVIFIFVIIVLVALCMYMMRSLGEMRDTLRELLIMSRMPTGPIIRA